MFRTVVPIIIFLIAQTVAAVYWAGTINQKVENLTVQIEKGVDDRYRAHDASMDLALRDQRINGLEKQIALTEDRCASDMSEIKKSILRMTESIAKIDGKFNRYIINENR